LVTVPKYRLQAQEIARQEGLLSGSGGESSRKSRTRKGISKQEEDAILRQIVEQKLDIKGGYKKPSENDDVFDASLTSVCFVQV
jgi:DnaJ homolog subfamily C member 25